MDSGGPGKESQERQGRCDSRNTNQGNRSVREILKRFITYEMNLPFRERSGTTRPVKSNRRLSRGDRSLRRSPFNPGRMTESERTVVPHLVVDDTVSVTCVQKSIRSRQSSGNIRKDESKKRRISGQCVKVKRSSQDIVRLYRFDPLKVCYLLSRSPVGSNLRTFPTLKEHKGDN